MIEALLTKLELRDRLHPDEKTALRVGFTPLREVDVGHEIVSQGSTPDESTLLIAGLTSRQVTMLDGSQQITAVHIAGDFVDLHSFLLRRMDHSVVALTPCSVTTLAHPKLRDLTSRFPHLARMLWLSTLLDSAIHRQWLACFGRRDTLGHLAHLVCELFLRLQVVGLAKGHAFEVPLTQTQLADVIGRSRAMVNSTVGALRATRFVTWIGSRIEILDWQALVDLAEFDSTYLHLTSMPV